MEEGGNKKHYMNFIIQVASGLFVLIVIFLVRKFKSKKENTHEKKIISGGKEASEVLKTGTIDKKTGKMKVLWNYKTKYTGNFDNDFYSYLKEAEGGLTKNQSDSAYKAALKIQSFPKDGFHTNMGITFETFVNNAKELKYDPSYSNFLKMPVDVWMKIYTQKYLNPVKNITGSKLLTTTLSNWAWGSGVKGAKDSFARFLVANGVTDIKDLEKKMSEKDIFLKMCEWRKQFYVTIAHNEDKKDDKGNIIVKDKDAKFLDGWENRLANYYNIFSPYAK